MTEAFCDSLPATAKPPFIPCDAYPQRRLASRVSTPHSTAFAVIRQEK